MSSLCPASVRAAECPDRSKTVCVRPGAGELPEFQQEWRFQAFERTNHVRSRLFGF